MQNTLLDPTALLDDEQRAWLDATMARNRSEFGGWSMVDDDEGDKDDDADGSDDGDDDQGDQDGDGGDDDGDEDWKAKFEAQQRINRQLERRTKKDAAKIRQLEGKPADKGGKPKSDDDTPDPEKIREEARAEARREALQDRVEAKIEAKAAKAFADPEDAVAVLLRSHDLEDFLDDGKVDVEAIADALKELGEKKPHLLAQGGRFKGGADGGRRKGKDTGRPKSLGDAVSNHYASGSQ